jgi:membrane-associated phospholipid phosphatase
MFSSLICSLEIVPAAAKSLATDKSSGYPSGRTMFAAAMFAAVSCLKKSGSLLDDLFIG